ncbi:hypothetical protein Bca52824_017966 [Brassica carinata]|uniref:Uncharacterized protein n=1 Tax=Brassica carinata TaxID=52824 RepID=A0A8X8AVY0_BRACI|nr:hypothetical protein Bca52824_017966 [Brassica carinata]
MVPPAPVGAAAMPPAAILHACRFQGLCRPLSRCRLALVSLAALHVRRAPGRAGQAASLLPPRAKAGVAGAKVPLLLPALSQLIGPAGAKAGVAGLWPAPPCLQMLAPGRAPLQASSCSAAAAQSGATGRSQLMAPWLQPAGQLPWAVPVEDESFKQSGRFYGRLIVDLGQSRHGFQGIKMLPLPEIMRRSHGWAPGLRQA